MNFNDRTLMVVPENEYKKAQNAHVVLIGVGGVGGAAFECLVRFGVEKITVIDCDDVDITNLNRQLIANYETIGTKKTLAAKNRAKIINPKCEVITHDVFLTKDNLDFISSLQADYIIDAIDNVSAKLKLITLCKEHNIPIISALGTGNRFSSAGFVIEDIENTKGNGCGLSRVIRQELRKTQVKNHTVLFNKNKAEATNTKSTNGKNAPGSTPFAPMIAGVMIAEYVISKLINK